MSDSKKILLVVFLPIIVIFLTILGLSFPDSLGVFLLTIAFLLIIPATLLAIYKSVKGSGVTVRTNQADAVGNAGTSVTSTTVVENTNTGKSWLGNIVTFAIILAVLGTAYYFLKGASWLPWAKPKPDGNWYYKSLEVQPPFREGHTARDSTMQKCKVEDSEIRFEMVCTNSRGTDIFLWNKTSSDTGNWWRKEAKERVYGTFTVVKDNPNVYLGLERTGSGRESVFRLYSSICDDCS